MYNKDKLIEMSIKALISFDEFCKKNNLEYSLAYGTELGSVRHGGFIPWDDDLDVDMPIEDYLRFEKIFKKEGDNKTYFLQTKRSDIYKPYLFFQLRCNGTTWIEPGKEHVPMHWGIAILDIFPAYHKPKSAFFSTMQERLYNHAKKFCKYSMNNPKAPYILQQLNRCISLILLNAAWVINFFSRNSEYIYLPYAHNHVTKKDYLYPSKNEKFENIIFKGHANPHRYLTDQYGDYMIPPPEAEREGHPAGIVDLENDYKLYLKTE